MRYDETTPADTAVQAIPNDLTGEADRLAAEAAALWDRATADRAAAVERSETARQAAAALVAAAAAEVQELSQSAARAEYDAPRIEGRAALLRRAAELQARAEDAETQARALEAERAALCEQLAGQDRDLAQLAAEQAGLERELTTARDALDVGAVTRVQGLLAGLEDVRATVTGKQRAGRALFDAIGDGEAAGTLHTALGAAAAARRRLRAVLNELDPSRPEARADEAMAALNAFRARMAGEAYEVQRQPPRPPLRLS